MEKIVRVYDSFAEAEEADRTYYGGLTPEQRMRILFELVEEHDGGDAAEEGFQRVYRIAELGQC